MPPASTIAANVRKWRRFILPDALCASVMRPHKHWTYQELRANSRGADNRTSRISPSHDHRQAMEASNRQYDDIGSHFSVWSRHGTPADPVRSGMDKAVLFLHASAEGRECPR